MPSGSLSYIPDVPSNSPAALPGTKLPTSLTCSYLCRVPPCYDGTFALPWTPVQEDKQRHLEFSDGHCFRGSANLTLNWTFSNGRNCQDHGSATILANWRQPGFRRLGEWICRPSVLPSGCVSAMLGGSIDFERAGKPVARGLTRDRPCNCPYEHQRPNCAGGCGPKKPESAK